MDPKRKIEQIFGKAYDNNNSKILVECTHFYSLELHIVLYVLTYLEFRRITNIFKMTTNF